MGRIVPARRNPSATSGDKALSTRNFMNWAPKEVRVRGLPQPHTEALREYPPTADRETNGGSLRRPCRLNHADHGRNRNAQTANTRNPSHLSRANGNPCEHHICTSLERTVSPALSIRELTYTNICIVRQATARKSKQKPCCSSCSQLAMLNLRSIESSDGSNNKGHLGRCHCGYPWPVRSGGLLTIQKEKVLPKLFS